MAAFYVQHQHKKLQTYSTGQEIAEASNTSASGGDPTGGA